MVRASSDPAVSWRQLSTVGLASQLPQRSHSLPRSPQSRSPTASAADNRATAAPDTYTATLSPRPSEPILVPKLRIRFADFPYLHCSTDQRLFTLETCCGYGYGFERESLAGRHKPGDYITHSHFQGPPRALRTPQEPWCFSGSASLSLGEPLPGTRPPYKEKTTLPEARADVCEFPSVASSGATPGGTSLLRFQVWDY